MNARMLILLVLVLLLFGLLPTWGYSSSWGYGPSGGVLLFVVIFALAMIFGKGSGRGV